MDFPSVGDRMRGRVVETTKMHGIDVCFLELEGFKRCRAINFGINNVRDYQHEMNDIYQLRIKGVDPEKGYIVVDDLLLTN